DRVLGVALVCLAWLAAAPARAAELAFQASLAVHVVGADPIEIPGSGVATVNGVAPVGGLLEQLALPAGVFDVSGLSIPVTGLSPISGVAATLVNEAGSFERDGASF